MRIVINISVIIMLMALTSGRLLHAMGTDHTPPKQAKESLTPTDPRMVELLHLLKQLEACHPLHPLAYDGTGPLRPSLQEKFDNLLQDIALSRTKTTR